MKKRKEDEEEEEEEAEEEEAEEEGEEELPFKNFEEMKNMLLMVNKEPVNNQTKADADNEVSNYEGGNNKSWVKNFMKSDNYDIEEVTGDGSCFFYCIARVILSLLGIKLTNEKKMLLLNY